MDFLKEKMNTIYPLTDETWNRFKTMLVIKEYPARHELSVIGEKATKAFFSLEGFTRSHMVSKKGKEINCHIFPAGSFFAAFTSLILKKDAKEGLVCITKCKVIEFDYTDFLKLVDQNLDMSIMHRKNLEKFYIALEKRELELASLTATERYLALIKRMPEIGLQVSQKHIAAHIGITHIQLSRLKKKLRSS